MDKKDNASVEVKDDHVVISMTGNVAYGRKQK